MEKSLEINPAEHGGFYVRRAAKQEGPFNGRAILFAGSLDQVFAFIRGAYDAQPVAKPASSSPAPKPASGSTAKPPAALPVVEAKGPESSIPPLPARPPLKAEARVSQARSTDVSPAPAPSLAAPPKQKSDPLDISILPHEAEILRELQQKTLLTKSFVAAIWGESAERMMTALIVKMRKAQIFIRVVMLQGWKVDAVDRKRLGALLDEMAASKAAAE